MQHYDLPDLAEAVGAAFTPGVLAAVDVDARHVRTSQSGVIEYDALLVAIGATPVIAVPGALTFRGPADTERLRLLLDEVAVGGPASLVFAIPHGPVWSLPAYELALMTATWLGQRGLDDVALTVVTPESQPLEVFGPEAAGSLREVLAEHRVALRTLAEPVEHREGRLELAEGDTIAADHVVALPCLEVPWLPGLPQTSRGFITVDAHGRVRGISGVYAAGDVTASPAQAWGHRRPAGRGGRRGDCGRRRRRRRAASGAPGAARPPAHRGRAPVPPLGAVPPRARRGERGAAVVAAGEGGRPPPRAVSGGAGGRGSGGVKFR